MENQELDWGKCKVVVDKNGQRGQAITIEDIVEGSTQLNTEQGQKTEAVIEGGEVIATRYQRNKYSLTFQEFGQPSIENIDGIVAGRIVRGKAYRAFHDLFSLNHQVFSNNNFCCLCSLLYSHNSPPCYSFVSSVATAHFIEPSSCRTASQV